MGNEKEKAAARQKASDMAWLMAGSCGMTHEAAKVFVRGCIESYDRGVRVAMDFQKRMGD